MSVPLSGTDGCIEDMRDDSSELLMRGLEESAELFRHRQMSLILSSCDYVVINIRC